MRRATSPLVLAALLLATVAPAARAVTDAPAPRIKNPELFEQSLEVARRATDEYGAHDDKEELARVNRIGYRVAQESRFTDFPLTFHTIDMPDPNAFALPGGHIFITRGMLDLGLDDDMLAALLGHEIAHVVLDHHIKMQRRSTWLNILGQALLVGVMIGANDSGGYDPYDPVGNAGRAQDRTDMVQGAAAASLILPELLLRRFSREHEDQSDEEGQRWAAAAGFDPDGANRLFALMRSRIPQSKKYGYWSTHPFFDERVRSGEARAKLLERDDTPAAADGFRLRTQATLLTWLGAASITSEDGYDEKAGSISRLTARFVEDEALATWPQGEAAERIRLAKLHRVREEELARQPLERDYGRVVRAYLEQEAEVLALTPETPFLARLGKEKASLGSQAEDLYPRARAVLEEGIFETPFLERFLSNWPEAEEVPRVALLLGDAHSRLGRPTQAVGYYLKAMEEAPESDEAQRAARGLKVLTPGLDRLAALERLAGQHRDAELAALAAGRLEARAGAFTDVDNGAEYMDRFPDGRYAEVVAERMNELADKLYAEVLLYQAVGDHVKAVERINTILTYAPLSPAADLLRERAVLEA
jgi:predicted Zn-dependent protease